MALRLVVVFALVFVAAPDARAECSGGVTLHAFYDLPRDDDRRHGLSGIAWDAESGVLWAVSDSRPSIVALRPDAGWKTFAFGETVTLPLRIKWDAEAVASGGDRFFIGAEAGPAVIEIDRNGRFLREVELPASFRKSRDNHGLESLALLPDRKTLVVANEHAFEGDGGMGDAREGTLVRMTLLPAGTQHAYRSDPVFDAGPDGRVGVVDVTPLSATRFLVTERHYVPHVGNAVRIYCADLAGDAVKKSLLVDVGNLPADGVPPPPGAQRHPLLDNFEGLAVGPNLPDGRRLLFLVSDDNSNPRQVARVLVLAVTRLMEKP